jgi:hypothetical protein
MGSLAEYFLYRSIPLGLALLAWLLKAMCLLSLYLNLVANDGFWSIMGLCAFIMVSLPAYFDATKVTSKEDLVLRQDNDPDKVIFSELFKTCCSAVFSDYKILLLSQIPLAIQVLAAGSVLYSIFGLDWVMHLLAGFSIGAVCVKAYKTAVGTYGYCKLASYFGFESSKIEGKWGSAWWALFCLVLVTVFWELMEQTVHFISPTNILRMGFEPLWNSAGDVIFGVFGGLAAWYLLEHKLHWG